MEYINSFIAIFTEMFCYQLFMETFCDYKSKAHRRKSPLMIAATFVVSDFILCNIAIFPLRQILVIVWLCVVSGRFFDAKPLRISALTVLYMGLLLAVDCAATLICLEWLWADENIEVMIRSVAVLMSKLMDFLVVLLIRRVADRSGRVDLTNAEWLLFLVFPVFSICMFAVFQANADRLEIKEDEQLLWTAAFGIVFLNFVMFYLMRSIARREEKLRENKLAEVKAGEQLRIYRSIVENYEKQNERIHEYRNQIECLQTLSKNANYPELDRYLEQIGGRLARRLDAVDTNHIVVNVIINSKYREAAENGILMVLGLDDLSELWLSEHDTVVLLGNLLDNAIEACRKLNGRRIIKVKMAIEAGGCLISVRNTYDGTIKSEEGRLLSTKEDTESVHGIGVKNIAKVIEKYGGSYLIEPLGSEFVFSIMLPKAYHNEEKRAG